MIERAELPVHKNRTCLGCSLIAAIAYLQHPALARSVSTGCAVLTGAQHEECAFSSAAGGGV